MKNILAITIILFSIVSGFFGSFVYINYFASDTSGYSKGSINQIKILESSITSLVEKASPSVVSIIVKKDLAIYKSDPWGFFRKRVGTVNKEIGGGTGFFITKDGIIITNKHVIADRNADYSIIMSNGDELEAQVIAIKQDNDLAFLQITSTNKIFQPLSFIDDGKIQTGQFSIAIGNALAEFQNSISFGVVSGINRSIEDNYMSLDGLIQTDTAINQGNSGGPLLNIEGKVMGINTAIIDGSQNIGFAIQLTQDEIDDFIQKIRSN